MRLKHLLCAALIAGLLGGCGGTAIPPDRLAGIKSIGVASGLGDVITRDTVGFVGFGNVETSGDISSWQLDDFIEAAIKDRLQLKFAVQELDADPGILNRGRDLTGLQALTTADTPVETRLVGALKPGQPAVDAYLVFLKQRGDSTRGGLYGLGVFSQGADVAVYGDYAIALIDARSHQVLRGVSFDSRLMLPGDLKLDRWGDYSEAQRARIRDALKVMLVQDITAYLYDTRLLP